MESDAELEYWIERQISDEDDTRMRDASQPSGTTQPDEYDSPPDDSNAYEDHLRACDADEERQADELYKHPRNGFGMQKSWKMVDLKTIETLEQGDGMPYFFLSEAEGPMLSSMATKQILVLLHMLHSPISGDHVMETMLLKPTVNAENNLEKLVEIVNVGDNPYKVTGDYDEALQRKVDDMPFETVLDFRGCGGTSESINRVVSVGEILVCPVTATYTKDVSSMMPACISVSSYICSLSQ
jgi:hypothetical protein